MGCDQKSFKLVCHKLLSVFLTSGPLPVSLLSANNEMIPETVHKSPAIYLATAQNPGNPSEEACATSHNLKWDPLPPNDVGRIAQHVREG